MKYKSNKCLSIASRGLVACVAILILLSACSRGDGKSEVDLIKDRKVSVSPNIPINYPREEDVRALVGSATYDFPSDYEGKVAILNRVLDGFQVAPSSLTSEDGYRVMWGFKFNEANFQSIAIVDKSDHLLLIGAVTNVVELVHGRSNVVSSVREYQDKVKATMSDPADATLFIDPRADLSKIIPLVKRWLQANLMGFNAGCNDERYRPACELLPYIEIPIAAFTVNKVKDGINNYSYELKELDLPSVPESGIPLEKFTQ